MKISFFFKFIQLLTKQGKKNIIFNKLFKVFFFFSFIYKMNFWTILYNSLEFVPLVFVIKNKMVLKKTISIPFLITKDKLNKYKLRLAINNFDKLSKKNLTEFMYKLIITCQDKTNFVYNYTQNNYLAFYRYRALNQVTLWL